MPSAGVVVVIIPSFVMSGSAGLRALHSPAMSRLGTSEVDCHFWGNILTAPSLESYASAQRSECCHFHLLCVSAPIPEEHGPASLAADSASLSLSRSTSVSLSLCLSSRSPLSITRDSVSLPCAAILQFKSLVSGDRCQDQSHKKKDLYGGCKAPKLKGNCSL